MRILVTTALYCLYPGSQPSDAKRCSIIFSIPESRVGEGYNARLQQSAERAKAVYQAMFMRWPSVAFRLQRSSAHYEHLPLSHSSCERKARLAPSLRPRHAPGSSRRPWGLGRYAGGSGSGDSACLHSVPSPGQDGLLGTALGVRLCGRSTTSASRFRSATPSSLRWLSAPPSASKLSPFAFKPPPLPILAPSLEPALAPNAFPITPPLSDLALASPLRFALRVDITALCQLPLLRSPKASPFLPTPSAPNHRL